jgi:hypothetical protein
MLKLTITQNELSFFKLIAILKGLLKDYQSLDIEIRYEEIVNIPDDFYDAPKMLSDSIKNGDLGEEMKAEYLKDF